MLRPQLAQLALLFFLIYKAVAKFKYFFYWFKCLTIRGLLCKFGRMGKKACCFTRASGQENKNNEHVNSCNTVLLQLETYGNIFMQTRARTSFFEEKEKMCKINGIKYCKMHAGTE